MKNIFRFITYSLLGLIFLSGLGALIYRNNIMEYFSGPELSLDTEVVASGALAALDLAPLSQPRFLSLKNNVIDFDFDNICHRPSAGVAQVTPAAAPTGSEDGTATTTATTTAATVLSCSTGNSLPFPSKK